MLSWGLAITGLLLGRTRPHVGLAVLVGVVIVTPSLDWQFGLPNLSTAFVYMFWLLIGTWWYRTVHKSSGSPVGPPDNPLNPHMTLAIQLSILTVAVSCLLALLRNVPLGGLHFQLRPAFANLSTFYPQGEAGPLQSAMIAIMGLLLLALFVEQLDTPSKRSMLTTAFTVGIVIAVSSRLLQGVFGLDPNVRPDKGVETGEGMVGFFQDQHSFAAFLLLAIGVSAGLTYSNFNTGRRGAASAYAGLTLMGSLILLYTNSRGGLLALAGAILISTFTWLALSLRVAATSEQGKRKLVVSSVLTVVLLGILVGMVVSPSLRGSVQHTLGGLGNPRMWEFLDPETAENPLLARRVLLWRKGANLVGERPIWGFGPRGYSSRGVAVRPELLDAYGDIHGVSELASAREELEVENAHSYFLQYAAEFGMPALISLLALVGLAMATILRGAYRSPDTFDRGLLWGIAFGQAAFLILSLVSHPLLLAELQGAFWTLSALGIATVIHRGNDRTTGASGANQ